MVLTDKTKKVILKRLQRSAINKISAILIISVIFGFVVMLILRFISDIDMSANMMVFGMFALMMFLFQIDDFLIAICRLVECRELKKAETKYDIVKASQIKPSPWPFHLGSRMLNHKRAFYEYEGKRRTRLLWANVMVKSKDYRLLLLVPGNKQKHIYAFPFVNFMDVVSEQTKLRGAEHAMHKGNEYLDDITYIRDIKHIQSGSRHQYDVLLAAQGYGWNTMIGWADYMAASDLDDVSEVTTANSSQGQDIDITESYKSNNGKCIETPELKTEKGVLTIAGISKTLRAPMKIVWFNQTRVMRFFTTIGDELLIQKYVETVIRRAFGTENAMKLGKPIPDKQ